MSARSYDVCPSCLDQHRKEVEHAQSDLDASYGKTSLPEFRQRQKDLEALRAKEPPETLAEYYDIGISDKGTFEVSYRASCDKCGYTFTYSDSCDTFAVLAGNQPSSNRKVHRSHIRDIL